MSGGGRTHMVHANDPGANAAYLYPPNFLKTSHYTLWNFVPRNLFEQFQQYSNQYFLLVLIFSLVPGVSPITPASAIAPLVFVLTVAACKDGYEDWKRHRADRLDNSTMVKVLRGGEWKDVRSMDVGVGDIMLLQRQESGGCEVKADILILSCDDEDGVVYIETSQLDGETSVKPRKVPAATQSYTTAESLSRLGPKNPLVIEADPPNERIHQWQGIMEHGGKRHPMGIKNVIWRGSSLRKTLWCHAVVLYTGPDSKQGKNLKQVKRKLSNLARKVNLLIAALFCLKHLLLFPMCAASIVWLSDNRSHWYLTHFVEEYELGEAFFLNYMTYFVLLSFLIPISLFVTVELCKVCQTVLMRWDVEMMHLVPGQGWLTCRPKTSDLNEQLASVKYIFSDKTGTLTENVMQYIEGAVFSEHRGDNGVRRVVRDAEAKELLAKRSEVKKFSVSDSTCDDVVRYVMSMALCNTVVPFKDGSGKMAFEGASPDEVALVKAARRKGYTLIKRTSKEMHLLWNARNEVMQFEVKDELEFTPTRKMMSVVITRDDEYILLTKGADSSILSALSQGAMSPGDKLRFDSLLVEYATAGLRTLCFAWRVLSKDEYLQWHEAFHAVHTTLGKTDEMVDDVCRKLERNLQLIGLAAYEDKLQDGVRETIKFFTNAGVVVWMLTGDKLETGIEIAKACGLADNAEILPVHLALERAGSVPLEDDKHLPEKERTRRKQMREQLLMRKITSALEYTKKRPTQKVAIAIDGYAIDVIQHEAEGGEGSIQKGFAQLSYRIHSAICCRLTPVQKGFIVDLFQKLSGETALAIGDGANDATMITAAMVGVGIIGLEGSQAELASDYAIPRFRHLKRLLAVHGRFALYRNARCVCFSFYKNLVLSMAQVYFAIFSAFSGATVYDSWLLAVKNTIFTSLPPLLIGCFGKDASEEVLMDATVGPQLYRQLRDGQYFSISAIAQWFIVGVLHGSAIFWITFPTLQQEDADPEGGRLSGLTVTGTVLMGSVVMCVVTKAAIHLHQITSIQAGGVVFSYALFPCWVLLYSAIPLVFGESQFYGVAVPFFYDPKTFLYCTLFSLGMVGVLDLSALYIQRKWFPSLRDEAADNYAYQDPPWSSSKYFCGCRRLVKHFMSHTPPSSAATPTSASPRAPALPIAETGETEMSPRRLLPPLPPHPDHLPLSVKIFGEAGSTDPDAPRLLSPVPVEGGRLSYLSSSPVR